MTIARTPILAALTSAFLAGPVAADDAPATPSEMQARVIGGQASPWRTVFRAWSKSLSKNTSGQLTFDVESEKLGVDETALLKTAKRDIDVLTLTNIGVCALDKALCQKLSPFTDGDKALATLEPAAARKATEAHFKDTPWRVLGFGRVGRIYLMGNAAGVKAMTATKRSPVKTWGWPGDTRWSAISKKHGDKLVSVSMSGVGEALAKDNVQLIAASPSAAVYLQWHTAVTGMSAEPIGNLYTVTLVKRSAFDALPAQSQQALLDTTDKAHRILFERLRKKDSESLKALTDLGVEAVPLAPQQLASWRKAAR